MSTKNITLHDENGNILLPATKTSRITDANGTNLDTLLQQAGRVRSISVNGVTQEADANGNINITSAAVVTNAPDEEDMTSKMQGSTEVLKFKDKAYDSALYSGLGRIYLRKNIVNGLNVLTQAMVNTSNTIYHIQYDYDLNWQTITIPAGCVLEFKGGSFKNGTLTGELNILTDSPCFYNINISGASAKHASSLWYDIQSGNDCTYILNNILNVDTPNVEILRYDFPLLVSAPSTEDSESQRSCVKINNGGKKIDFAGNTIQITANNYAKYNIIEVKADNLVIENLNVIGDVETHTGTSGEFGHGVKISTAHDVFIEKCTFTKCWGDGIDIIDRGDEYPYNITLNNCKSLRNRRQGISIEAGRNINIVDCEFAYTGAIAATAPTCGVDIEPWRDGDASKVVGVVFKNCDIHDNLGVSEMNITPCWNHTEEYASYISLTNCRVWNTSSRKMAFYASRTHNILIDDCVFGTKEWNSESTIRNSNFAELRDSFVYGCFHINTCEDFYVTNSIIKRGNETITTSTDGAGYASNCAVYTMSSNGIIEKCFIDCLYPTALYLQGSGSGSLLFSECEFLHKTTNNTAINLNAITCIFKNSVISTQGAVRFENVGQITFDGNDISANSQYFLSLYGAHNSDVTYDYVFKNNSIAGVGTSVIVTNSAGKIGYLEQEMENVVFAGALVANNYTIERRKKGTSIQRPTFATNTYVGYSYYDETISKSIIWNGSKWIDGIGFTAALSKGSSSERPTNLTTSDVGFEYYDTTIWENIVWNGVAWMSQNGIIGFTYSKDLTTEMLVGKFYKVTSTTASSTTSAENRFNTIRREVNAGDVIKIVGVGGSSPRLYAFATSETTDNVIYVYPAMSPPTSVVSLYVKAPQNCYLIVNCCNNRYSPQYGNNDEVPYEVMLYSNTNPEQQEQTE